MNLSTLLDWYRSAFLAVMPMCAEWRVEQEVYWLPFSAGVGLCATSDGQVVHVELCRGLSGESLLATDHKLGTPLDVAATTRWVGSCVERVLQETGEILKLFGASLPVELGPILSASIPLPGEVRLLKPPTDPSGWELHKSPMFYESTTDLVQDLRAIPYGSVVVFLHRNHEDALNLTAHLIVGNQQRSSPARNPLYYVTVEDAPRIIAAMRRANLGQAAIDRLRIRSEADTEDLALYDKNPQFVVVSLRDVVGTNRFEAHLREVIGTDDEERIPLYHIIFAYVPEAVDDAIASIRQVDTLPTISHMYLLERAYHFRLVWSDDKLPAEKKPLRDHIYLPPFSL